MNGVALTALFRHDELILYEEIKEIVSCLNSVTTTKPLKELIYKELESVGIKRNFFRRIGEYVNKELAIFFGVTRHSIMFTMRIYGRCGEEKAAQYRLRLAAETYKFFIQIINALFHRWENYKCQRENSQPRLLTKTGTGLYRLRKRRK